ncbi:unnamed protein product [Macrosiphum euphorbiae]|nr:unnamed protein product [Macrosiphum euphorbiae]CAI6369176.1 unnamed protein product [Macrosiphum euphorbiae]CAI6377327.1 unnamed protein product [Macrosiphum euphorbiae]
MDYNYYMNALKVIAVAESFGYLNPPRRDREFWIHPFNKSREEKARFINFYADIRQYPLKFFEYYRMSITSFDELLEQVRPHITKKVTTFRYPVSAEERLTLTIR